VAWDIPFGLSSVDHVFSHGAFDCAVTVARLCLLVVVPFNSFQKFKSNQLAMPHVPDFALAPPANNVVGGADAGGAAPNGANVNQLAPSLQLELLFLMAVLAALFYREMGRDDGMGAALGGTRDGVMGVFVVCLGLLFLKFGRGNLFARNANANGGNAAN